MNHPEINAARNTCGTINAVIVCLLAMFLQRGYTQEAQSLRQIQGSQPLNIIFILSDDHRYDFFGFLDKPKFLETPHLDRLALQGAHLQNAFVTTSLCSPSRASVLSGQYSFNHQVVDNDAPMPEHIVFFPKYLKEAGYRTAFVGKWHMGHHTDAPQPDFDHWVSFPGQGVYYNPKFNVDGKHVEHSGYITDLLTDYAVEWINRQRDQPFLLYLSHKAVHAEFQPAKRHLGRYDNVALDYPSSMSNSEENYEGKPRWVRRQRDSWHGVDFMFHGEMDFDTFYRRYCETLLGVDESVGRILNTLQENGLLESTLFLYMGDNGFSFGEHGLIDKRHMYEESIRVPLLAHCPELIQPGTTVNQMVQNVDIAPSILHAAGLAIPKNMDGQSFLALLQGQEVPWREEVFYVYYWERPFPHTPTVFGVRTEDYKYMTYHGIWDTDELYDLKNDPEEMRNLIEHPEHQELVKELRNKVFDWLEENGGMQISLKRSGLWQANKRSTDEK